VIHLLEKEGRLTEGKTFLDETFIVYYISDRQQQKERALVVKLIDTKNLKAKAFTNFIVSDSLR
jgi:hypothetical protein